MALAMTDIVLTIPLSIFTIWLNATSTPIARWISWTDTHFNYSRIEQIPALIWRQNRLLIVSIEFTRWTTVFCSLVFFAYFGFADEAKKNYRLVLLFLLKRVGYSPSAPPSLPLWSIRYEALFSCTHLYLIRIYRDFKKSRTPLANDLAEATRSTFVPLDNMERTPSLTSSLRSLDYTSSAVSSQLLTPRNDDSFTCITSSTLKRGEVNKS